MRDKRAALPFEILGAELKTLRNRACETLAEASGAVEIDTKKLIDFELGRDRPSEETLLLLISHFNTRDDDALKLWELAGYTGHAQDNDSQARPDNQLVMFTDSVEITANQYGVVIDFLQSTSGGMGPVTISKLGMSREHAESVLHALAIALANSVPSGANLLNSPSTDKSS